MIMDILMYAPLGNNIPKERIGGAEVGCLRSIDMIKEGTLDLNNSISHTFPLTKAQEAFDFVDSRDPSIRKIVFTFDF